MAEAFQQIRSGEKRPLFGRVTVDSGTLTVQATPTCTLYNAAGTVVTGISAVNVTGYDASAITNPRVWYNLDTSAAGPAGALAAGYYTLVFKLTAVGSDSITRIYEPEVAIEITSMP